MSHRLFEIHAQPARETRQARRWYSRRSPRASREFLEELELTFGKILAEPERYETYLHSTRRCKLDRYPYLVVYRVEPSRIRVIAVAHGHRRPGYWSRRLR